jgi:uncharacterized protein YnzC (UPF0291/DUF896 family)
MIPRELIDKINLLAKKQREIGLDETEKQEQAEVRAEYLKLIRGQVESQLKQLKPENGTCNCGEQCSDRHHDHHHEHNGSCGCNRNK